MIRAYCDRCNREISPNIDEEYLVDIDVKTTGWVGNRNEDYYSKDFKATNATRKFILCNECLSKFSDMVKSFMELQQKKEENKQ